MAGTVIYEAHPTMFRAHPFWFIGCIILIPVFGLGVFCCSIGTSTRGRLRLPHRQ